MNPIRTILVIVDPTAQEHPAVSKAARLAQALRAELELFICDTKASREMRLSAQARWTPRQPPALGEKALLENLAQPLREEGLAVSVEIACGEPLYKGLLDRVRRRGADLVVKDTHHHSLLRRTFLSNTDWQLIRGCPASLLLTKAQSWGGAPAVFAALDPGHANDKPALLDRRILDCASALARRLGGELHVLHAYVPTAVAAAASATVPPMAVSVPAQDLADEEAAKAAQLRALVSDCRVQAANIHVEAGGPLEVLPRVAGDLGADVLVMGAIARSALQRVFVGSTAEDVLEHLPCDALIVKPPEFDLAGAAPEPW